MDFIPNETSAQLLQRITDEKKWRYKQSPVLQETHDGGRVLPGSEIIVDERYYYMTGWIEAILK